MYWLHVLLFFASTTCVLATDYSSDVTNNGPYIIARCGAGQPNSRASRLQSVLKQTGAFILNAIIPTAQRGVVGSRAFASFFTSDSNIDQVVSIFNQIVGGAAVPAYGGGTRPVQFTCLNPDDDVLVYKMFYQGLCVERPGSGGMAWISGTEWIVLCPNAFISFDFLNANACPKVQNNKLVPNDMVIGNGDLFVFIIHELAHVYGISSDPDSDRTPEVYNIQDAIDLPAAAQAKNAANYALFANGKSLLHVLHNEFHRTSQCEKSIRTYTCSKKHVWSAMSEAADKIDSVAHWVPPPKTSIWKRRRSAEEGLLYRIDQQRNDKFLQYHGWSHSRDGHSASQHCLQQLVDYQRHHSIFQ